MPEGRSTSPEAERPERETQKVCGLAQPAPLERSGTQVSTNQEPQWQKSTFCGTGTCVEVARTAEAVLVRDSRNPQITPLAFTTDEWIAFIEGVKAGEFG
jgi:hypothetical protein